MLQPNADYDVEYYCLQCEVPITKQLPASCRQRTTMASQDSETNEHSSPPRRRKMSIEIGDPEASSTWFDIIYFLHKHSFIAYAAIILMSLLITPPDNNSFNRRNLEDIKNKHLGQEEKLWDAFESGVDDVLEFNKPSTLILLYKSQSEQEIENILQDLTKYILYRLDSPDEDPIILTDKILNSEPFTTDYGEVLGKYGEELKTKKVMIVKNLDKVDGKVAQAFHALCDEYTPYVEQSVIIFTVKVDEFPENEDKYIEDLLRKNWNDLKEHIFSPLITRISGMILRVHDPVRSNTEFPFSSRHFWSLILALTPALVLWVLLQQYSNIFHLIDTYPQFRESILKNLLVISTEDQFLICDSKLFKDEIINYLKIEYRLPGHVIVNNSNFDDVAKIFCNGTDETDNMNATKCLVLIEGIEDIHQKLCELFRQSEHLKKYLKQNHLLIVYTVENEKLHFDALEKFLSKEFLKIIPSVKVLRASRF